MMPILWRYSIGHFLKIVAACVLSFIAILLTMRLDEIAHFAALGAPLAYILLFTLYQIPYILPIALPLSCLIAALLFIQRLSNTHELTALRASGFAIRDIIAPILLTSAFLAVFNFWVVSELATRSHLQANLLKSELRSINPLLLLHNKHLMRLKGLYFEALGASRVGESASDVVLAIPNKHHQRINLLIAQNLKASPTLFIGQGVTLLTGSAGEAAEGFDNLLVENMAESITHVQDFSQLLQKKVWTINNDYLQLPLLLVRIKEQTRALEQAKKEKADAPQLKQAKAQLNRSLAEIIKRSSIAIAVFSFTLMGACFGINISRRRHYRSLYMPIGLTTFYLIAFFVAKGVDQNLSLSSSLYLVPHLIIIAASIFVLNRVSKGIE
ncbi:LptF/LptG family permease [Candidatus Protochlamydia phocaeensis]|uniref:LptF/LptG family permease n=1 Tax=Candidatus Protochlamydia phocaeensis TaxID=1414722 RepID=UPI0009AC04B8|nr:LptF/LptG family permease [Candidatus Protochlamydia phocaeensis]